MKNLILTIIITLAVFAGVFGQSGTVDPKRGSAPGAAMSISDIENINLTSGNLSLNVPLVSLPASRGGMSASMGWVYNSKIYKPIIEEIVVSNEITDQNLLYPSDEGGWRPTDSLDFRLKVVDRLNESPSIPCSQANNQHYNKNAFRWKVMITMPDGNDKEFRPVGYGTMIDGYSNFAPDGKLWDSAGYSTCWVGYSTVTTSPITYYSADGSFVRMVKDPSSDAFSLYFPDGSDYQSTTKQLTDRFGNYIKRVSFTHNSKDANGIEDNVGRRVFWTDGTTTSEKKYYQTGFSNQLIEWTVKLKPTYVRRQYQTTANAGHRERGGSSTQIIETNFEVVDEIILPDVLGGQNYVFEYSGSDTEPSSSQYTSGYGEIASVELPSGAITEYEFGTGFENTDRILSQGVTKKTLNYNAEYDGSSAPVEDIWTYSYSVSTNDQTTISSPDGSGSLQRHWASNAEIPFRGYVRRIENPNGSKTEKLWATNLTPWGGENAFVKTEFTSIMDANGNYSLTAIKEFTQDKNGNTTSIKEYDFVSYCSVPRTSGYCTGYPTGLPSGISPVRTTYTSYFNATPDSSDSTTNPTYAYWNHNGIKGVVASTEVLDSSNQTVSKTEFTYDNYSTTANPILTRTWDSTKGSLTTPLTDTNSVKTQATYHSTYGFPLTTTDANGVVTTITYGCIDGSSSCASHLQNLYPTKTEVASNYSSLMRTSSAKYDYYTGVVTEAKDVDNDIATVTEYDDLGRPTKVRSADGKSLESWTRTTYDDANRRVIVESDLETKGDYKKVATQFFDQLGRVRLAKTLEDASTQSATNESDGIKVQTRYGYHSGSPSTMNGSYTLTSNPFRAATSSAASSEATMGWTVEFEHANGRLETSESFAGPGLPSIWGSNTNSNGKAEESEDSNTTTTIDESGKKRRTIVDAFGRLVRVDEPNSSNELGDVTSPNQATEYTFDTLGNLTQILQGGQTRTFTYSSLSRLLSATNPESGTFQHTYDANGNLLTKTDARGVSTTFTYDALNRVTFRNYSDSTPDVTYVYDETSVAFSKGKLTKTSSSVSESAITSYDAQERITGSKQVTAGQTYTFGYTYNLDDDLTSQTYPSGRIVNFAYDASGDLGQVTNPSGFAYANSFNYTPRGEVEKLRLGNKKWETTQFNSRRQITQIGLGYSASDTGLWKTNYDYGDWNGSSVDTSKNNGNVARQTITVPTIGAVTGMTAVQSYTYDSLDRLRSAKETISSSQTWKQTFNYDRFGNRNFDTGNTTLQSVDSATAKVTNPEILTSNNRFKLDQDNDSVNDYGYDSSGNLTKNAQGRDFTYNAENLQITATGSGLNVSYAYDGNNKRVKTYDSINDRTTIFVYDANGDLAAEYTINVTPPTSPTISYLTNDALGSLRVTTDSYGDVKARRDFLPFGEELYSGLASRNANQKYSSNTDDIRKKFATYQRDVETGLDFAQSRYYSSMHGRFASPDEFKGGPDELFDFEEEASSNPTFYADLTNPQSLNKYQYVYGNPYKYNDPSGHCPWCRILSSPAARRVIDWAIRQGSQLIGRPTTTTVVTPQPAQQVVYAVVRTAPAVVNVAKTVAPKITKATRAANLAKNKQAGNTWAKKVNLGMNKGYKNVQREVTLKTKSGTKVRVDNIGTRNGKPELVESKASQSAALTKNQKIAFPEIQKSGGVVVGKGKPGYPPGTIIDPQKVRVVRGNP